MDDKRLSMICFAIIIVGIAGFFLAYKNEFEETSIGALLEKQGNRGIVFGRIEHVIKNYPSTMFILTDGNSATVYYPKETDLNKNDFVRVYAESEYHSGAKEIYAYKVAKDG